MIMATSLVQIRVEEELKTEASKVYEKLGIDLPTAVRMFLKRTVLENGIPFSMTLPRTEYKAERAMRAMYEINESARRNGIEDMSLEEINAEISEYRKENDRKVRGDL